MKKRRRAGRAGPAGGRKGWALVAGAAKGRGRREGVGAGPRAEPPGTAGGRSGWTLLPRSNKARDRRKALTELPTMTGTAGVPAAEPVSRPRSLTSFRNSVANSRSRSTRRGSRWRTVRAARAAAALGGEGPTLETKPGGGGLAGAR